MRHANIDLIYFNAGGGHRAAALALEAVAQAQRRPWQMRRVNLFEVLDPDDRFRRITGLSPEDLYDKRMSAGWTLGLAQELKLLQGLIRMGHPSMVRRLQQHWLRSEPDLIVSLVPNFNRALFASAAATLPGVPCVTVLTDMADHPPHFWIEPGVHQHVVCGTPKAAQQAAKAGLPPERIHRTSGMVIRPDFYEPRSLDRAAARARLGLHPDRPVGLVMFGGQGSMAMLDIAQRLPDVQLILMCGNHRVLMNELSDIADSQRAAPRLIVGYTPDVRNYMAMADFFIGKPGPGCLSEAVQQGLPVITFRNAWTLPQERYNADWVLDNGLGLVVRSTRRLAEAVQTLLAKLPEFRARVRQIDNQAVFEVPDLLAQLLQGVEHVEVPLNAVAARSSAGVPTSGRKPWSRPRQPSVS
jgi:UDP-N-acetylglucosamine:LPS N-acetylglucosamine transferase